MRLLEMFGNQAPEDLIKLIATKGKPYLDAAGIAQTGAMLKRGTNGSGQDVELKTIRDDRKPRDSTPWQHGLYTEVFERAGAVANRHNSLFVTTNWQIAEMFGPLHAIFPLGPINYSYIEGVKDITEAMPASELFQNYSLIYRAKKEELVAKQKLTDYGMHNVLYKMVLDNWNRPFEHSEWDWEGIDEKITSRVVVDKNLEQAIDGGWEIMLRCPAYLQVRWQYYHEQLREPLNKVL